MALVGLRLRVLGGEEGLSVALRADSGVHELTTASGTGLSGCLAARGLRVRAGAETRSGACWTRSRSSRTPRWRRGPTPTWKRRTWAGSAWKSPAGYGSKRRPGSGWRRTGACSPGPTSGRSGSAGSRSRPCTRRSRTAPGFRWRSRRAGATPAGGMRSGARKGTGSTAAPASAVRPAARWKPAGLRDGLPAPPRRTHAVQRLRLRRGRPAGAAGRPLRRPPAARPGPRPGVGRGAKFPGRGGPATGTGPPRNPPVLTPLSGPGDPAGQRSAGRHRGPDRLTARKTEEGSPFHSFDTFLRDPEPTAASPVGPQAPDTPSSGRHPQSSSRREPLRFPCCRSGTVRHQSSLTCMPSPPEPGRRSVPTARLP